MGVTFARRGNFSRGDILARESHFCTASLLHEGLFLHEVTLLHGVTIARRVAFARGDIFTR